MSNLENAKNAVDTRVKDLRVVAEHADKAIKALLTPATHGC